MSDPMRPPITTLMKLGSIAVHADEFLSSNGHEFDRIALQQLLLDEEVQQWLHAMGKMAMIPVKR